MSADLNKANVFISEQDAIILDMCDALEKKDTCHLCDS